MLVMAQMLKEISQEKEILISLLRKLCFMINLKNSQATLVKEIEFLGLVNSVNMTLTLPLGKVLDIQNRYMQLTASPNTTIMELTTPMKTLVHCSGSVSWENSVQVLATTTDLGSDRNKLLSTQNKIKPTVTDRAEVMEENLLLQNDKPLKKGMPKLIIQMDAFKTTWGQSIWEPQWGEFGHIRKEQNISMYWSSLW